MALKCGISSLKSNSFKFFQETGGKEVEKGKNTEGGKKKKRKSIIEIASSALIHKKLSFLSVAQVQISVIPEIAGL